MNVVSAAFSSYVLALAKNSYKKHACKKLMKLTAGTNVSTLKMQCTTGKQIGSCNLALINKKIAIEKE